jgi:hypothetical protein
MSSQTEDKKLVQVRLTAEGWFVEFDGKAVGPFEHLRDVDEVSVAERLGVAPKQVFSAKMKVQSKLSRAVKLPDPEQILVNENVVVIPSFNDAIFKIHPAIDVVGERAYVGVYLPCVIQRKNENYREELPFLITSLREKILCQKETLSKLNLKLAYRPLPLNRWSLEGIAAFINGYNVDPAEVYIAVKTTWQEHIDSDEEGFYDFMALWTIGTYFHVLFNAYPYVYLGGTKRSGKTKALTVASCLAFNAIFSANISTSSVFRLIQSGRCTVLIDEIEQLANPERRQDFRSLLLSGYKKGGLVYRTEKNSRERHVPEAFEVYSPKMLANIRGLEDVLEDRVIPFIMKRSINLQIVNREIDLNSPVWQEIRDKLYALFLTYWREVADLYEAFSVGSVCSVGSEPDNDMSFLSARELELWKPIVVLAQFFQKHLSLTGSQHTQPTLPTLILNLARRKSRERQVEEMTETGENILVQTLLDVVQSDGYYSLKQIRMAVAASFDEEQKWLTNEWVGRALKRLGFSEKRRVGPGVEYYLTQKAVENLAERMGIRAKPITVKVKDQFKPVEAPTAFSQNSLFSSAETPTVKNEVKLHSSTRLSIAEVFEKINFTFVEGTEEEFLAHAIDAGLTKDEARNLFEKWKGERLFWFERDGKTIWRLIHP